MFQQLPQGTQSECEALIGGAIHSVVPVGGGSISQACLLKTTRGDFFLKTNMGVGAKAMFETEQKGLKILGATKTIRTPKIIGLISDENTEGLLLEFIETGYRNNDFWAKFGTSLAELHRHSAAQFGLDHNNFIGSLPQPNGQHDTWPEFYIHERLLPQIEMAKRENRMLSRDFDSFEKLFKKLPDLCPNEPPALIHGDLWSGNFLVSSESEPVLIDPAVGHAHREMDLAMSRLFGGFDRLFYESYEEAWPLTSGFEKRLPIYQLYYLMVHVNLFGGGYVRSVRNILNDFV